MTSKNKFGFGALTDSEPVTPRRREVGPMGAAVRDAASSLSESTENLVELRRQNAVDAKEFRAAVADGRLLVRLAINEVRTDDLPRDRMDLEAAASSDEMAELKTSIRERGQREPIEVFAVGIGEFQLKKGWRRLTALRQLHAETGDPRFAEVVARVSPGGGDRIALYIDMVEENVIREDLSFAEMAQIAIVAARDLEVEGLDAEAAVGRLFGSLHKMKRSYIRSFVVLLEVLGDDLKFPKAVSRNLGVDVSRRLQGDRTSAPPLRELLRDAGSAEEQARILQEFAGAAASTTAVEGSAQRSREKSVKYEFHVGSAKVTARRGECRILSGRDFSSVDRARLKRAIEAFEEVLDG